MAVYLSACYLLLVVYLIESGWLKSLLQNIVLFLVQVPDYYYL